MGERTHARDRTRQPRLHGAPRRAAEGIIGAGVTLTAPEEGEHWIAAKAAAGVPGLYLLMRFEVLSTTPLVTFDDLARPPYSRFRWGIRASGTRLPSTLADASRRCGRNEHRSEAVEQADHAAAAAVQDVRVDDCRADVGGPSSSCTVRMS
jgi:hypothetical protein